MLWNVRQLLSDTQRRGVCDRSETQEAPPGIRGRGQGYEQVMNLTSPAA